MRRGIVCLSVLMIGAIVAAAASAAAGDPRREFTKGDQALARSIVLQKAELPGSGWTARRGNTNGPNPHCAGYGFDLSDLVETGEYEIDYQHGTLSGITSDAAIFKTVAQARQAYVRVAKPGLGHCLAATATRQASRANAQVHIRIRSVRPLHETAAGPVGQATSARISLTVDGNGRSVPLYLDYTILQRGRTVALTSFTQALRPIPVSLEQRLLAKIRSRSR